MYSYSQNNDFNTILARLLANVNDRFDKREGSIIYDALAPAAAELAQCYIALDVFSNQTYLLTAVGENLDARVVDYGVSRIPATYAQVIIQVLDGNNTAMTIDLGTRFATPNEYGGYNFTIIENQSAGMYIAQCETLGTAGNTYLGEVLPLQSVNNLGSATITSVYKPGEDAETDAVLRARTLRKLNQEAFAGNKAAYREMAVEIDGVEDCKVFPIWDGGGTVKLALIAANHTLPSSDFIESVQEMIDPILKLGYTCSGTETGTYHFSYDSINYQFTMPTVQSGDMLIFNTRTTKLYKGTTEITTTTGTSGTELTFVEISGGQGKGLGLAPIGHTVTVVSPTADNLTITATLELESGATLSQLQSAIYEQIYAYIYQVQNDFIDKNTLLIYLSKVSAAILNVKEVKNVSSLTINGNATDYTIDNSAGTTIKYPIIQQNGVVLNEAT